MDEKPRRSLGNLVILHTGNGKGKTTAALGTAFRAMGHGWRVCMVQFIKGKWKPGEVRMASKLAADQFEIIPMGEGFTWESDNLQKKTRLRHNALGDRQESCYPAISNSSFWMRSPIPSRTSFST
jgi:cob(I)alamin adenosyltransferase